MMPISFYSPPALTPEQSGAIPDILGNILSGYEGVSKARYLQPGLEEALKQVKLGNEKTSLENKYYVPEMQSQMAARNQQIAASRAQMIANKFGNTREGQLLNLWQNPEARAIFDRQMGGGRGIPVEQSASGIPFSPQAPDYNNEIINSANSSRPVEQMNRGPSSFDAFISEALAQQDKQYAPTDLAKTANEMRAINSGFYPGTQIPIQDPDEQRMLKEAYGTKLSHMRAGETLVYDETGTKPIGERVHYTPLERERSAGREFFDLATPVINKGFSGFKGKESIKDYMKYVNNYSTDSVAKEKIDDLLLAQKLVTPTIVNEMQTIGSGKQKVMFQALQKAFPGTDLPSALTGFVNQLQLPQEAFNRANERAAQFISEKTREAADSVPATHIRYFNPQVSKEIQKEMTQEEGEEEVTPEMAASELARRNKGRR